MNARVLTLKEVATATLQAASSRNGEDGQLVSSGAALKLMGAVVQVVAQNSSEAQLRRQWKDTGLDLYAFLPSVSNSMLFLPSFICYFVHSLVCCSAFFLFLVPLHHSSIHPFICFFVCSLMFALGIQL